MDKKNFAFFMFFLSAVLLVLSACGGGGDGGGGGTSGSGVTYTGLATQATIDVSNAEKITLGGYQGGVTAGAAGLGAVVSEKPVRPIYLDLSSAIKEFIKQVDLRTSSGIVDAGAMSNNSSQSGTMTGPDGGEASYSITVNDATGSFSGTLSYNGYETHTTVLTGSCSYSGTVNMTNGEMTQFSLNADNMTIASGGESYTVKMTIGFTASSSTQITITADIVMRDNITGKTYWVNNYNMTAMDESTYTGISISGRYYDPDYGYVDISTPTPLKFGYTGSYPYDGILVVAGKGTSARLTILSATSYKVEADTDGDSVYDDWSSGIKNW